jgi:hypothetical protein
VLINVFFVAVFLIDRGGAELEKRRALDDLRTVLHNGGIALNTDALSEGEPLPALITERDVAAEELLALAVLGKAERTSSGGNIYSYSNEKGRVAFNGRGEFVIDLDYSTETGDAASVTARILKAMGVETTTPVAVGGDGNETVTARCAYKGAEIFNCQVAFSFTEGYVKHASGRRPTGIAAAESGELFDVYTALTMFGAAESGGDVTEITAALAGYRFYVNAFGEGELLPGWRVATDAGDFFVNSITGEVESLDE